MISTRFYCPRIRLSMSSPEPAEACDPTTITCLCHARQISLEKPRAPTTETEGLYPRQKCGMPEVEIWKLWDSVVLLSLYEKTNVTLLLISWQKSAKCPDNRPQSHACGCLLIFNSWLINEIPHIWMNVHIANDLEDSKTLGKCFLINCSSM